jgi:hypothetical protein
MSDVVGEDSLVFLASEGGALGDGVGCRDEEDGDGTRPARSGVRLDTRDARRIIRDLLPMRPPRRLVFLLVLRIAHWSLPT